MTDILNTFTTYWTYFLTGTRVTIMLALLTVVFGSLIGSLGALMRLSNNKVLNTIAGVYISVFRGTPLIVQLWICYFQLTKLIPFPQCTIWGVDMARFLPCMIALALNSGAYVSEIIRAGIQAVDRGQMEAARSIGMPKSMAMKLIVLPQAIKNILPAIGNEFVTMIKETAIIQYLGIPDLMYSADAVKFITYQPLPSLYCAAIIYFILTYVTSKGVNIFEGRLNRSDNR